MSYANVSEQNIQINSPQRLKLHASPVRCVVALPVFRKWESSMDQLASTFYALHVFDGRGTDFEIIVTVYTCEGRWEKMRIK